MERYRRDFFISRLQAGYLRYKHEDLVLYIHTPTHDLEYEAQEYYLERHEMARDMGVWEDEQLLAWMHDEGMWSEKQENEMSKIVPDHIEYWKVELFHASLKAKQRETFRKYLKVAREELYDLIDKRYEWSYITCAGSAALDKWHYILEKCVKYPDGSPYDWRHVSLTQVSEYCHRNSITDDELRELARTDPWRNIWSCGIKDSSIFPLPSKDQSRLISWSMLYDNVYESTERPHEDIIQDDDMLDGWLITQRKEREKEQNKKVGEEKMGQNAKIQGADEVFIMTDNADDAKKITDMNSVYGEKIIKSRMKALEEKGELHVTQLPDMQQRIRMQFNAERKGRK